MGSQGVSKCSWGKPSFSQETRGSVPEGCRGVGGDILLMTSGVPENTTQDLKVYRE